MYFLRNNKIQKLSTTFLLCLFVLINAVKIFHTHDFPYSTQIEKSNKNATVVKAAFFCAICDFQIAKDSDAETASIIISAPERDSTGFNDYISSVAFAFNITSSVRGPPAFLS